jgi:tetratricopeptide (TPR) repeat protein
MQEIGRLREAHDLLSAAALARQRQFPERHSLVINTRGYLADVDCDIGDAADVETRFVELIAFANGPGTEIAATDLARLYFTDAQCLLQSGRLDDARRELEHAREKNLQVAAKDSPYVLAMDSALADIERRAGDPAAALAALAPILARQRERGDRELPASLLAAAEAYIALGKFDLAQTALDEARKLLGRQGRPASMLAREVEIAWTALPASVPGAQGVAEHWRRVAQIGCINFGCDDERVRQWRNRAGDAAMPAATAKPYEAQYAIGADIVAKAQAAANAGAAPAKP